MKKNLVKIEGVTYRVTLRETPEELFERGYRKVAFRMRLNKEAAKLMVRRPSGRVVWMVVEREDGTYSNMVRLGPVG